MVAFAQERRSWKSVQGSYYAYRTNQANWLTLDIGERNVGLSRYRLYDGELGIFLSRDRLPYLNKYRAWSNDPCSQLDRDGLRSEAQARIQWLINMIKTSREWEDFFRKQAAGFEDAGYPKAAEKAIEDAEGFSKSAAEYEAQLQNLLDKLAEGEESTDLPDGPDAPLPPDSISEAASRLEKEIRKSLEGRTGITVEQIIALLRLFQSFKLNKTGSLKLNIKGIVKVSPCEVRVVFDVAFEPTLLGLFHFVRKAKWIPGPVKAAVNRMHQLLRKLGVIKFLRKHKNAFRPSVKIGAQVLIDCRGPMITTEKFTFTIRGTGDIAVPYLPIKVYMGIESVYNVSKTPPTVKTRGSISAFPRVSRGGTGVGMSIPLYQSDLNLPETPIPGF